MHEVQEPEQTVSIQYRVKHADNSNYLINLHGLHNAQLIRKALPDHLYALRKQTTDTDKLFSSAVEKLSIAKLQKARLAAAKKKAKGIVDEVLEGAPGDVDADADAGVGALLDVEVAVPSAGDQNAESGNRKRAVRSTSVSSKSKVHRLHCSLTCFTDLLFRQQRRKV